MLHQKDIQWFGVKKHSKKPKLVEEFNSVFINKPDNRLPKQYPYQKYRIRQAEPLIFQFGSRALSELNLLDSGTCEVKRSYFQFVKNKETNQTDLILTLDYETSAEKGPLAEWCKFYSHEPDKLQFKRETFAINYPGPMKLVSREVVINTHVVVPPQKPPYASISSTTPLMFENFKQSSLGWILNPGIVFFVLWVALERNFKLGKSITKQKHIA